MHLAELKMKSPADLVSFAESLNIENASSLHKQDMLFAILKNLAENDQPIQVEDRHVNPEVAPDYLTQDFTSQTPNAYLMRVAPLASSVRRLA